MRVVVPESEPTPYADDGSCAETWLLDGTHRRFDHTSASPRSAMKWAGHRHRWSPSPNDRHRTAGTHGRGVPMASKAAEPSPTNEEARLTAFRWLHRHVTVRRRSQLGPRSPTRAASERRQPRRHQPHKPASKIRGQAPELGSADHRGRRALGDSLRRELLNRRQLSPNTFTGRLRKRELGRTSHTGRRAD